MCDKKYMEKHISDKKYLAYYEIRRLVIGALSYYITVFGGQGLVALLLGAYGSIVQFAPAVYSALYWRRATASGVISGLMLEQ